MTEVSALRIPGEKADYFSLLFSGHAVGSSQVCDSVTMIFWSLAGYLANHPEMRGECRDSGGAEGSITFAGGPEALAVYEMALIGLKQLEQQRPEFLRVREVQPEF